MLTLRSSMIGATFVLTHGLLGQDAQIVYDRAQRMVGNDSALHAMPLFKRAAELGHAAAQFAYGYCFESGNGVEQSDFLACAWYLKAAEQGNLDAQYTLGYRYARGRGVKQSDEESYHWMQKCALQKDIECMYNVITCYYRGSGTSQSMDSVIVWAKMISRESSKDLTLSGKITSARLNMAHIYDKADGVTRDPILSYAWYLMYNENKDDHSVLVQQQAVNDILRIEAEISSSEKERAHAEAEELLGRRLMKLPELHETGH